MFHFTLAHKVKHRYQSFIDPNYIPDRLASSYNVRNFNVLSKAQTSMSTTQHTWLNVGVGDAGETVTSLSRPLPHEHWR